jgi:hypothetical protein
VDVFFDVPDNPEVNAVYVDEEVSLFASHSLPSLSYCFAAFLRFAATLPEAMCKLLRATMCHAGNTEDVNAAAACRFAAHVMM